MKKRSLKISIYMYIISFKARAPLMGAPEGKNLKIDKVS